MESTVTNASNSNQDTEKIIRVSSSTDVHKLANSIIAAYEKAPNDNIILRAIGAGALNQATKAAITSNKFFSSQGLTVCLIPSFKRFNEVPPGGGAERETIAIEFRVYLKRS